MCVVSAITPAFDPVIPQPTPNWPGVGGAGGYQQPWYPLPGQRVDRLAGQPDCEDAEKVALRARVAELEKRLTDIAAMSGGSHSVQK